ncbi:hypothetical protein EZS27_030498 [termite gut metagenome]|uniref:Uncharacterized protein n=1 Tax=termite gut metagenome TaxID=433724 RepID=A0A5J4QD61_9ZZZZ
MNPKKTTEEATEKLLHENAVTERMNGILKAEWLDMEE